MLLFELIQQIFLLLFSYCLSVIDLLSVIVAVKMRGWNFLMGILELVHIHSTSIGKIWLTIVFVFRVLPLMAAVEHVWLNEHADFLSNTKQPGCSRSTTGCCRPFLGLLPLWFLWGTLLMGSGY